MSLNFVTDVLLPIALFTMMLGIGASTSVREFIDVVKTPKPLILGICSLSLVSPLVGIAVAYMPELPPEISLGLILLAACPGGLFSNYMTALGRGALALSISLTVLASLVYVFAAPFWAQVGLSFFGTATNEIVQVPYMKVLKPLLVFLLLPVVLGMTGKLNWPVFTDKSNKVIRDIGGIAAIICFIIIVYAQRSSFVENMKISLVPVMVFNFTMVGIALLMTKILSLNAADITAVIIEHTIRQEATGIYIALVVLGSLMATVPLIINTIIGMSVSMVVVMFGRRFSVASTQE